MTAMADLQSCPKCGGSDVDRDSVDVGVGIMYGPWGCASCGWSEDERYDSSNGPSPAQLEHPDHIVDSRGGLLPMAKVRRGLEYLQELSPDELEQPLTEARS